MRITFNIRKTVQKILGIEHNEKNEKNEQTKR